MVVLTSNYGKLENPLLLRQQEKLVNRIVNPRCSIQTKAGLTTVKTSFECNRLVQSSLQHVATQSLELKQSNLRQNLDNPALSSTYGGNATLLQNRLLPSSSSQNEKRLVNATTSTYRMASDNLKRDLQCLPCQQFQERRLLGSTVTGSKLTATSSLLQSKSLATHSENKRLIEEEATPEEHHVEEDESEIEIRKLPIEEKKEYEGEIFPPVGKQKLSDVTNSLSALDNVKRELISSVSEALVNPIKNFSRTNKQCDNLIANLEKVANSYDPEFILKLALYSRNHLNLRTISNFLLAFASTHEKTRPYLRRYFDKTIVLPTDWIEVAEIYQGLDPKAEHSKFGTLSTALRKALVRKFPDFDEYQLGKYNRQKRKKKKPESDNREIKVSRGKKMIKKATPARPPATQDKDTGRKFTLKQLIRMTHISKPVGFVMSILGKRYPNTPEEFQQLGLPGVFDSERAGKRMKLAIPETWETQISARGNKAEVWEELLDHNKLPFMAMLRNLRNMLQAGISEKHHKRVLFKLTDVRTVVRSKQFPFRFFSAFGVIKELEDKLKKFNESPEQPTRTNIGKKESKLSLKKNLKMQRRQARAKFIRYTEAQLESYKRALGQSVKIATHYNLKPIANKTYIICDLRSTWFRPITANPFGMEKTKAEMMALMALMCQHACESSVFVVFHDDGWEVVPLSKDNILERATRLLSLVARALGLDLARVAEDREKKIQEIERNATTDFESVFPMTILNRLIKEHRKIDNLIVITENDRNYGQRLDGILAPFRARYRNMVNSDLLFVQMYVGKAPPRVNYTVFPDHKNDIFVSGISEQVLQYIAEFGNGAQLQHVSAIDKAYGLHKIPVFVDDSKPEGKQNSAAGQGEPVESKVNELNKDDIERRSFSIRKIRVFISSTFKDMKLERDLIVNHVMPKAREVHGKRDNLLPYEVDLRWGVVAETAYTSSALAVCLEEVQRCDVFVGLLGSRYGSCPDKYSVPLTPEFEWVNDIPSGLSVTELEIRQAMQLKKPMLILIRNHKTHEASDEPREEEFNSDKLRDLIGLLRKKARKLSFLQVTDYTLNVAASEFAKLEKQKQVQKMTPFVSHLEKVLAPCISTFKSATVVPRSWLDEQDESHAKALIKYADNALHRKQLYEEVLRAIDRVGNPSQWKVKFTSKTDKDGNSGALPKKYNQYAPSADDMGEDTAFGGGIIAIKGEQGIGKSVLMSFLVNSLGAVKGGRGCESRGLFYHFVDAGNGSRNLHCLLQRLYAVLNRDFHIGNEIPASLKDLITSLPKWLKSASIMMKSQTKRALVFIIDGLNDMDDSKDGSASNLDWIPQKLPKGCVFVISARTRSLLEKLVDGRASESFTVASFNTNERRALITSKLALFGKRLDENAFNNQLSALATKRDAAKPLYIAYACEELKRFSVFEQLSVKVKSLPNTLSLLLEAMCKSMETDYGSKLVSESLICLLLSPEGLEERDLTRLLCALKIMGKVQNVTFEHALSVFDDGVATIPALVLADLISSLKVFLGISSGPKSLDGFSTPLRFDDSPVRVGSSLVASSIEQRYLNKADKHSSRSYYNKILAALHTHRVGTVYKDAKRTCVGKWSLVEKAPYSLILHHLVRSGDIAQFKSLVTDLTFVKLCFQTHAQYDLLHFLSLEASALDLPKSACKEFANLLADKNVVAVLRFVQDNLQVLNRTPELIFQQATFSPSLRNSQICISEKKEDSNGDRVLNFDWLNKPEMMSPKLFTISDFSVPVESLDVNEAKSLLAVGIKDCRFCVYDTKTGKLVKEVLGVASPTSCVKFADSNKLVVGTDGGQMSMYSVTDWHKVATMNGHDRRVSGIARDPGGMTIATVGWDCALKLWNISNGKLESEIDNPAPCPINSIDWHPLKALVAIACWDSTIKLWNLTEKKKIYSYRGHRQSVRAALFTKPEGIHLISSSLDGDLRLWSVVDRCALTVIHSSPSYLSHLCLTKAGKLLLGACGDGRLKVWGTSLGEQWASLPLKNKELTGESSKKYSVDTVESVAILESANLLAVSLSIGVIRVYENWTILQREFKVHEKPKIVIVQLDGFLTKIFYASSNQLYVFSITETNASPEACMTDTIDDLGLRVTTEYSQSSCITHFVGKKGTNDYFLAVGTQMGTVEVLKVKPLGKPKRLAHAALLESCFKIENAHEGTVTGISFDDKCLITCGKDKSIVCWERKKKDHPPEAVKSVDDAHNDWINCLDVKEGVIVTGSSDNIVKVWKSKGKDKEKNGPASCMPLEMQLTGHSQSVVSVKYIPEAGVILSCDSSGVLNAWKSSTGTLLSSKECGRNGIQVGAMACWTCEVPSRSDEEKPVQVLLDWAAEVDKQEELEKQKKKLVPTGANDKVAKMKVMVALGHRTEAVTIWDALAGELRGNLFGHSNRVNCISEATDDVFSGSHDTSVIKWSCTNQLQMESACRKYHDCCVSAIACYKSGAEVRVLSGDHTGQLVVSDFKTGKQLRLLSSDEESFSPERVHKGVITSIFAKPPTKDGKILVVTSGLDQDVVLIELEEKPLKDSSDVAIFAREVVRCTCPSPIIKMRHFGKWQQPDTLMLCCWNGLYYTSFSRTGFQPLGSFYVGISRQWFADCMWMAHPSSPDKRNIFMFDEEPCCVAYISVLKGVTDTPGPITCSWVFNREQPANNNIALCHHTTACAMDKMRSVVWRGSDSGDVVAVYLNNDPKDEWIDMPVEMPDYEIEKRKITVHEGKVTGLQVVANLLFSSGTDSFVRVWKITTEEGDIDDKNFKLVQVAEFSTTAPVSNMNVLADEGKVHVEMPSAILIGDTLGNIYCLTFRPEPVKLLMNSTGNSR